jgi:predicted enzyme related to lactoylglutathione lyase
MPKLVALMIHTSDPNAARLWYQAAFPEAVVVDSIPGLEALCLGDIQLEFVCADAKVASGPAGTVAYWQVPEFDSALAALESLGARLYRGPLNVENGITMCQVRDPWGNCIGITGPKR